MKGDTQVPWIIVIIVLSLIVLFVLGTMIVSGKKTGEGQFKQTDLWNCCENCWAAANPDGTIGNDVECPLSGGGTANLIVLYEDVRGTRITNCEQIGPFCKRSN